MAIAAPEALPEQLLDSAEIKRALPEVPRPLLTGWVNKKKSEGAKSRLVGSSNRRFYTVDFNSQVVYYGHTEDSKSVSMPVPFKDILKVEPLQSEKARPASPAEARPASPAEASLERSDSKGSLTSKSSGLRKRVSSLGAVARRPFGDQQQHGLVLHTTGKTAELLFGSEADAQTWIEAFREAIAMSGGDKAREEAAGQDVSTASPSSGTGTAAPSPRSQAEDSTGDLQSLPDADTKLEEESSQAQAKPSSRPGSGTGLQAKAASFLSRSFGSAAKAGMQSPQNVSGGSIWGYGGKKDDGAQAKATACRYGDKAKGLSLQERLAQLDFSDNEDDDDDDPTAAARKPSARGMAERAAKAESQIQNLVAKAEPQSAVVVEACQDFVLEPDSDDD